MARRGDGIADEKAKRRPRGERGIRQVRVNGRLVWQVRVACQGQRRSRLCETFDQARQAKGELLAEIDQAAGQVEQEAQSPATLRQLLAYYALDMAARGKAAESVGRVDYTRRSIEALLPELLEKPVGAIADADLFAYRNLRAREGSTVYQVVAGQRVKVRVPTKPSTINRDLRTLRAALKKARPEYRFPGGAFFPEDETRVRWLRPDEELLVLEPMPSPFREMAKLAALTLMRQGEIRRLRPSTAALMAPSHSRNVNGYVTAELRRRRLAAQLEAKERALDPLRVKVRDAATAAKIRYRKLTGGQLTEARRLLEADPAIAAVS